MKNFVIGYKRYRVTKIRRNVYFVKKTLASEEWVSVLYGATTKVEPIRKNSRTRGQLFGTTDG